MTFSTNTEGSGNGWSPTAYETERWRLIYDTLVTYLGSDWLGKSDGINQSQLYLAIREAIYAAIKHEEKVNPSSKLSSFKDVHIKLYQVGFNAKFTLQFPTELVIPSIVHIFRLINEVSDQVLKALEEELTPNGGDIDLPNTLQLDQNDDGKVEEIIEFLPLKPIRAQELDEDENDSTFHVQRSNNISTRKNQVIK